MIGKIKGYLKIIEKAAIPQLSINCVIFGFHDRQLKMVVNNINIGEDNIVVLPGGYVGQTENLTDAVERIVKESTGLENILFKQFAVFGDASRSFGKEVDVKGHWDKQIIDWVSQRFISVCYLALVDFNKIELKPTQFLEAAQWLSMSKTKVLAMDHNDIAKSARETLVKELPYSPIASNLLPQKFTLPDLQALVEAIIGRDIDRPNFRRKILASGTIVKIGQDKSGKRRPADLYKFTQGKETSLNGISYYSK
jgi:8-oxo-dGTP diphosphatase